MSVDAGVVRQSRRALLAGLLGGLGAVAAQAVGRPLTALGTDGDPVTVGDTTLTATRTTKITNTTNSQSVITGASKVGVGIRGSSSSSFGGSFTSETSAALVTLSTDSTGVFGRSGIPPFPANPDSTGVFGYANQDSHSVGVLGDSPKGIGVRGHSSQGIAGSFRSDARDAVDAVTNSGAVGVYGQSASGTGVIGIASPIDVGRLPDANTGVLGFGTTAVRGDSRGGGAGVFGSSGSTDIPVGPTKVGVLGVSNVDTDAIGVHGVSKTGVGVQGDTGANTGVLGNAVSGDAVVGITASGHGIYGIATDATGMAGLFQGRVFLGGVMDIETAAPGVPAPDIARLFVRNNASGKTQLCVRFNTGAVIVLATQA